MCIFFGFQSIQTIMRMKLVKQQEVECNISNQKIFEEVLFQFFHAKDHLQKNAYGTGNMSVRVKRQSNFTCVRFTDQSKYRKLCHLQNSPFFPSYIAQTKFSEISNIKPKNMQKSKMKIISPFFFISHITVLSDVQPIIYSTFYPFTKYNQGSSKAHFYVKKLYF